MSLYDRYSDDNMSDELFNSVYDDLFKIAERQQKVIAAHVANNGGKIWKGEAQDNLDRWCFATLSLGEANDFIAANRIISK